MKYWITIIECNNNNNNIYYWMKKLNYELILWFHNKIVWSIAGEKWPIKIKISFII